MGHKPRMRLDRDQPRSHASSIRESPIVNESCDRISAREPLWSRASTLRVVPPPVLTNEHNVSFVIGHMQQPLPTPSSQSPYPDDRPSQAELDHPKPSPRNNGSAPFHILAVLFDKLSDERRQDKRRNMIAVWFDVCY